ncbi:N-formylglutamate amidohydrolase [Gluconacetobacter diazotrophicus PA1 5]|uniref:N-formylglutamate amidohydrolase n=1 Tax=Gluconacetobacter diazotrophicus TaxID=33996 RepID=UPI000173D423|nr:N-formylglutamate amidohydrolase [Gluconacetobacter diazotrophicus PA1 5]TWB07766.1 N-formylglutamate deformylase [Gluconacetobacter diazotrophicus]
MNDESAPVPAPFVLVPPRVAGIPLVVASPHSGRAYPRDFLALSRVDHMALRHSEDFHVDELLADAPDLGASLIHATFPRIYCDTNREAGELDSAMFDAPLPPGCNSTTQRVRAGLGVIPRISATGLPLYRRRLPLAEAHARISRFWAPYHAALSTLLDAQVAAHGACLLVDCHSMPGIRPGIGQEAPHFVLGDVWGTSCAAPITAAAEESLRAQGFRTCRNAPYAGGYITRHYGNPAAGRHALQVEISRPLYMDESRLVRREGFAAMRTVMTTLLRAMAGVAAGLSRAPVPLP